MWSVCFVCDFQLSCADQVRPDCNQMLYAANPYVVILRFVKRKEKKISSFLADFQCGCVGGLVD